MQLLWRGCVYVLCVCMCVCVWMYICIYVYVYIYIYIYKKLIECSWCGEGMSMYYAFVCVHVCVYIRTHTRTHTHILWILNMQERTPERRARDAQPSINNFASDSSMADATNGVRKQLLQQPHQIHLQGPVLAKRWVMCVFLWRRMVW
jgi:hypothetical protein